MGSKLRLLIIEDEPAILVGLVDVFTYHGYEVASAVDGESGLRLALAGRYDLILLDLMLPKLDGFAVCNAIRERDRRQPIIMLTARTAEEDIITGLSLGADDYVAKPFSVRQLVLRVEAVLRRSPQAAAREAELRVGPWVIDTRNLQGRPVDQPEPTAFSRREVEILLYLAAHNDRPVGRGELLEQVWGYQRAGQIETRTVDIHIAKLRKKIEVDPKEPRWLVTIRGEGYKLLAAELGVRHGSG